MELISKEEDQIVKELMNTFKDKDKAIQHAQLVINANKGDSRREDITEKWIIIRNKLKGSISGIDDRH